MNSNSPTSNPQKVIPPSENSVGISKAFARNCLLHLEPHTHTVYIQVESGSLPPKVVIVIEGEQTVLHDPTAPTEKK